MNNDNEIVTLKCKKTLLKNYQPNRFSEVLDSFFFMEGEYYTFRKSSIGYCYYVEIAGLGLSPEEVKETFYTEAELRQLKIKSVLDEGEDS
jgi:hypothetical protein